MGLKEKRIHGDDMSRFQAGYVPVTETGCWLWMRHIPSDGYGRIKMKRKVTLAHRVSWELHNGPIPDGLCVLHKCDVRCCVNPEHLFLGTNKDNTHDSVNKERRRGMKNAPKEFKMRGRYHEG